MTNPLINAFFLGRATAEVLSEELEHGVTDLLGNIGRFNAEQRDRLQNLTQTIMERAEAEASTVSQTRSAPGEASANGQQSDIQEVIDELRAEIAQLRSALQTYRQQQGS
ncbi:MAG: hypothetical protein HC852_06450 [Acaryochloridaceae cyanobacterium RU_4_10]|nr:hypothetical protein [Acaryochloridaceae cyanobacterium RU_4_10]